MLISAKSQQIRAVLYSFDYNHHILCRRRRRRRRRGRRDAFHAVIDRKTDGRTDERRVEWKEGEREGKSRKKQEEARLISLHIPATDTYRAFETDWMRVGC